MPQYRHPRDAGRSGERGWRGEHYQTSPDQDRYETGNERRYAADWREPDRRDTASRPGYEGDRRYAASGYPEEFGYRRGERGSRTREPRAGDERGSAEDRWAHQDRWAREDRWADAGWRDEDWRTNEPHDRNDRPQDWESRYGGRRYGRGGFTGQRYRGYGDFNRAPFGRGMREQGWESGAQGEYYGTGRHYGGGYGTAAGTRASAAGSWDNERDDRLSQGVGAGDDEYGSSVYESRSSYLRDYGLADHRSGQPGRLHGPGEDRDLRGEDTGARGSFQGLGPRGYERSDERLKELICERLTDDPRIDASDLCVDVSQRVVKLSGTVQDRRTKYEVEELVESCGGVKDIDNQLRVQSATQFSRASPSSRESHAGMQSASAGRADDANSQDANSQSVVSNASAQSASSSGGSPASRTGENRGSVGSRRR